MTPVRIPRYIDAPAQLAFWEADEIIPMILLFGFGIVTQTLTWMLLVIAVSQYLYRRYKASNRTGAVFSFLFWYGMYDFGGLYKNGLARTYIG